MKITIKHVVIVLAISFLASLACNFTGCSMLNKAKESFKEEKSLLMASDNTLTQFKSKDGYNVAQINALKVHEVSLEAALKDKDKQIEDYKRIADEMGIKLRNATSFTEVIQKTGYDSGVTKAPVITVPIISTTDTSKPRPFKLNFKKEGVFYSISGEVDNNEVVFHKLIFLDSLYIITATKKSWFLAKPKYVVSLANSNPYVSTQGLNNITIQPNRSIFDHPLFFMGVGAAIFESARVAITHHL